MFLQSSTHTAHLLPVPQRFVQIVKGFCRENRNQKSPHAMPFRARRCVSNSRGTRESEGGEGGGKERLEASLLVSQKCLQKKSPECQGPSH